MGAVISYFLIGVAIGAITLVLMATIGRVKKLQKLIDGLSEGVINKFEQQDLRIDNLLQLTEDTAQTLSKVVDKIDMHDQEFFDQQIMIDMHDKVFIDHRKMIDKHDQTFIAHRKMIDHLNKKIIKLGGN